MADQSAVRRQSAGPEKFFYDKSTYTGAHKRDGRHSVPGHTEPAVTSPAAQPKRLSADFGDRKGLVGPERFFYDKTSYTGTHGAPEPNHNKPANSPSASTTASSQNSSRRPSKGSVDGTIPDAMAGRGNGSLVGPERFFYDKKTYTGSHNETRRASEIAKEKEIEAALKPKAGGQTRVSGQRGSVGPERFFYDKSSYTGAHKDK